MDDLNRDEDTDALIRQWSESLQLSKPELSALSAEICSRAAQQPVESARLVTRSRVLTLAGVLAATAAALLIFVLNSRPPSANSSDAEFTRIAAIPWERMHTLASECARLFDHRVAWLAEANQDLSLGVEEDAESVGDQEKPQVTVRIVVFHRKDKTKEWESVYTSNIVTREEEVIELRGADDSRLRLWTHILPDQAIAVDSDLSLGKGSLAHWVTTTVLSEVGTAAVEPQRIGDGEYQVWQSAAVMKDKPL